MRALQLLLAVVGLPVALAAQAPDAPSIIRTSGTGFRVVTPDRVAVTVAVSTKGRTPSQAGASNARVANAIRAAVVALGVPADSITTLGYSVQMVVGNYDRDTGFVSTNTVLIRLRRLPLITRIIDTALTAGATNLSGVSYSADDTSSPVREALQSAVSDARTKAQAMARASGGRLGRLVLLTTERLPTSPAWGFEEASASALSPRDAGPSTTITPGPLSVGAWVLGQWEFLPGQ